MCTTYSHTHQVHTAITTSLSFCHTGERFVPETFESGYKITMRLTIYDVDISDFGAYRCVAKNSLGDTDGAIKLYRKYARQ